MINKMEKKMITMEKSKADKTKDSAYLYYLEVLSYINEGKMSPDEIVNTIVKVEKKYPTMDIYKNKPALNFEHDEKWHPNIK